MRIRTIKPEFFLHSELFDLELETGLPIRVAYVGLWCACDRRGRFKWRPRELKARILPYDECDFSRVLHALTTRGFLVPYACNTRPDASNHASQEPEYGWIPGFERHQVINNREKDSILPSPDESTLLTRELRVDDACATRHGNCKAEGKGREGNKEGKGKEHGSEVEARVIAYLNAKTGSQFREVKSHLDLIKARLKEPGVTEEGIRQMIDRQVLKWGLDPKMCEYLRPQTLFGATKFQSYYDQRELPVVADDRNGHRPTPADERNHFIGGAEVWESTSGKLAQEEGTGFGPR